MSIERWPRRVFRYYKLRSIRIRSLPNINMMQLKDRVVGGLMEWVGTVVGVVVVERRAAHAGTCVDSEELLPSGMVR